MDTIIRATVAYDISLTREELDLLLSCSEHHYDGVCKAESQHGGFLYGWNNRLTWYETDAERTSPMPRFDADHRKLDIMSKILEMPPPEKRSDAFILSMHIRQAFNWAREDFPNIEIKVPNPRQKQ